MFFGHNFCTTNARWPIKGYRDADFRLVFFLKKETKIGSRSWGPGPDDVGQKGLNLSLL